MIGLIFFLVVGLWLLLCVYLARKIPKWLGIKRFGWVLGLLVFPVLVVAPVIDEVIGKQQFASLCERRVFYESNNTFKTNRTRKTEPSYKDIPGYWIPIQGRTIQYFDADDGRLILSYDTYHTNGGWLLGGSYIFGMERYCHSTKAEIESTMKLEQLLAQGKKQ